MPNRPRLKPRQRAKQSDEPQQEKSTSTQAHSQAWEEPPSLRKGSEQLHVRARQTDFASAQKPAPQAQGPQGPQTRLQQFEALVTATAGDAAPAQGGGPRRRLYSLYERAPAEAFAEAQGRPDDYLVKYKTEICKNFQFRGQCQWGDAVG